MIARVDPVELGAVLLVTTVPTDRALTGWDPPERSWGGSGEALRQQFTVYVAEEVPE